MGTSDLLSRMHVSKHTAPDSRTGDGGVDAISRDECSSLRGMVSGRVRVGFLGKGYGKD